VPHLAAEFAGSDDLTRSLCHLIQTRLGRTPVHALGDAVGYRPVDRDKAGALTLDTYGAIQAKIGAEMKVLKGRLAGSGSEHYR